jgi:uncharacterized RDD family membrane protein YckC
LYCDKCGNEFDEETTLCRYCWAELKQVSWGERISAWLIDVFILSILLYWIVLPGFDWLPEAWGPFFPRWVPYREFGFSNLIYFLYWTILEGTYGQSIGKRIMRIKVTDLDGQDISLYMAAYQSIGKAFLLPFDCIFGWIQYSSNQQRLFNYLSKTMVVRDREPVSMMHHLDFFRDTMPVALKAGEELAKYFDFTKVKTVVDVGGLSGGLAIALKREYPHLNLRVDDLPEIVPVTKTILNENNVFDIEVLPCNILKGPLSESCDVAILRAVIQVLASKFAEVGIRNVSESINPGGYLIILGHMLDDSSISPGAAFGYYTKAQFSEWIGRSGLIDIRFGCLPNGDKIIIARKP